MKLEQIGEGKTVEQQIKYTHKQTNTHNRINMNIFQQGKVPHLFTIFPLCSSMSW